jgi:hypothetical protein
MRWNWEKPDWPNFHWNPALLVSAEKRFLLGAGTVV